RQGGARRAVRQRPAPGRDRGIQQAGRAHDHQPDRARHPGRPAGRQEALSGAGAGLNTPPWTLEALGEDAVLLRLGACVEMQLNRQVHALAARISAARPPWLLDIVPAYAALALYIDPGHLLARDRFALDLAEDWLAGLPAG